MVKIFFLASGVGFSELCRIVMTFCHISVSRIFEQNPTEICVEVSRARLDVLDDFSVGRCTARLLILPRR